MASLQTSSGANWKYKLPDAQLGSDDPSDIYHQTAGEIVHSRLGIPVSVRPWVTNDKWRYNLNMTTELAVATLKIFFDRRVFYLQPTSVDTLQYLVRWVESEFIAEYIKPGFYSISFTLEKVQA